MGRLRVNRGSIMVESVVVLPLLILLTVGGASLFFWTYTKTVLTMVAYADAERAAKTAPIGALMETAYDLFQDVRGKSQVQYGIVVHDVHGHIPHPLGRKVATPLPTAGTAIALTCATAPGLIPPAPVIKAAPPPSDRLADQVNDKLGEVRQVADEVESLIDDLDEWINRFVWYRRVADQLTGSSQHKQLQAIHYVAGVGMERAYSWAACDDHGQMGVFSARAVIRGEETVRQR